MSKLLGGWRAALLAGAVLGAGVAAPRAAMAEICEDLWLTRNQIMHRAGYCFGSTLGKAVFGDRGCVGKSITLGPSEQNIVNEIRRKEKAESCNVDVSRRVLPLADLSIRRQLMDLPVRDEFESACLGWRAAKAPLKDGHSAGAARVGWIEPGDFVRFSHISVGEWSYVTTHSVGWGVLKSGGWVRWAEFDAKTCEAMAG